MEEGEAVDRREERHKETLSSIWELAAPLHTDRRIPPTPPKTRGRSNSELWVTGGPLILWALTKPIVGTLHARREARCRAGLGQGHGQASNAAGSPLQLLHQIPGMGREGQEGRWEGY